MKIDLFYTGLFQVYRNLLQYTRIFYMTFFYLILGCCKDKHLIFALAYPVLTLDPVTNISEQRNVSALCVSS